MDFFLSDSERPNMVQQPTPVQLAKQKEVSCTTRQRLLLCRKSPWENSADLKWDNAWNNIISLYIYIYVCVCACMNKTIVYVYTPVICVLYIYIWNLIACMYLFLCLRRGMPYDVHVWSKRYTICQCSFTNVLNTHFRSAFNSFKTCVIPTHYTTELHTITFW